MAVFENRQPVTAAKFINKSSLSILLPGFIRRLELKPINKQKVENIFVAPPYCQTACCTNTLLVCQTVQPKVSCLPELKECCLCVEQVRLLGRLASVRWVCVPDHVPDLQRWLVRVVVSFALVGWVLKVLRCVQLLSVCKVILAVCKQKVFVCTVILATCT